MNRRALLASLAATGGTLGTAGCIQRLRTSAGGTSTRNVTDPTTTPGTRPPADESREADAGDEDWNPERPPVETLSFGDRESIAFPDASQPHGVHAWNRVDEERELTVVVADAGSQDRTPLEPVAVPGGGLLVVQLQVPSRYELAFDVDGRDLGPVVVDRTWFDCNHSTSRYALAEREVVDYGTESTLVACADPEVASTSVDVASRGCASDDDARAAITYDGEAVRVDGTFVASAPCYDLDLEADYHEDARTLVAVLDATAPEDEACADCVGAIAYDATVAFDRDLPDHVAVHHRDAAGQTERVGTATRNG